MASELDNLSPSKRAYYHRIGRYVGSDDSIAQANITLEAHGKFGAAIAPYGFGQGHATRLVNLRAEGQAMLKTRQTTGLTSKQTRTDAMGAEAEGKGARFQARSVLITGYEDISDVESNPSAEMTDLLGKISHVLAHTQSSAGDKAELARQLEHIHEVLVRPELTPFIAEVGGPEATARVAKAIAALKPVLDLAPSTGVTVPDTERLDIIDGLIVTLCRRARRAARLAASARREPSIAHAFELDAFSRKPRATTPAPPPTAAPSEPVA